MSLRDELRAATILEWYSRGLKKGRPPAEASIIAACPPSERQEMKDGMLGVRWFHEEPAAFAGALAESGRREEEERK